MAIYDLSPLASSRLPVWPGDNGLSREIVSDLSAGATVTVSTLRSTVHLGSHADAPSHYAAAGASIDERALEYYLGPCQVIRVAVGRNERILPKHLTTRVTAPRILFATGTFPNPEEFTTDFAALSPELIESLHQQGVMTIGIDTPSVDLFSDKKLISHQAFGRYNMAILEGLVLATVPSGEYELIALPLRLAGFDASPVRAVLRTV